jgi:hypothetical protein
MILPAHNEAGVLQRKLENCLNLNIEGIAPDFLSVLHTVEHDSCAITELRARRIIRSVRRTQDEFQRNVRTLIRGMRASRLTHGG